MKWAIVGAGAQGRVTLDILRAANAEDEFVFLEDNPKLTGRRVCQTEVVARAVFLANCDPRESCAIIAIGHNERRLEVAEELARVGVRFGNAIHPSATIMPSAMLGVGIMLCPGAIVGTAATVGDHALINSNAVVEHDCAIGAGASLSPGAHMAGRVRIGCAAFVGTGASLNPRITIGRQAIIGTGAVVTTDVRPGMLAYGAPAREVRPVDAERDWGRLL